MTRQGPGEAAPPGAGARAQFQLPRFDFRSDGQIDREIDEEIAFHLDQLAREFAAEGALPEEARAKAIERFGDVETIKAQCRRIALEDRIMLQKINFAIMLVVLAAVVGVSLYVMTTQKHNTLALNEIVTRIASMRMEAEAAARQQAQVAEESARAAMEQAHQERARAEAVTDFLQSVLVSADPSAEGQVTLANVLDQAETQLESFADQPELQAEIRQAIEAARQEAPDDELDRRHPMLQSDLSGFWREIDEKGAFVENGATLRLMAPNDIRNISGQHVGVVEFPAVSASSQVYLEPTQTGSNLSVRVHSGNRATGRWIMQSDGVLLLNLGNRNLPPIALKKVGTEIPPRTVTVEGAVGNPGPVEIPLLDLMSILEAVMAAGRTTERPCTIELHRKARGEVRAIGQVAIDAEGKVIEDGTQVLESGDRIVVLPGIQDAAQRTGAHAQGGDQIEVEVQLDQLLPGDWSAIDDTGARIESGASLHVLPADDITSLNGLPHGTLQVRLPAGSTIETQLEFDVVSSVSRNLTYRFMTGGEEQRRLYQGRWVMEDGHLVLNLPEAPESIGSMILRLARISESSRN